jgi:PIN domain nuclease of toxin-antitoxin system
VILLDTHVVFWAMAQPERLSRAATRAIATAERGEGLALCSISLWELASLNAAGRLHVEGSLEAFLNKIATRADLAVLDITPEIAVLAAQFPRSFPGDPIDRLIGGTARAHGLALVTKDQRLQDSPLIRSIW